MSDEAAKADDAATETPPIELLEKAVADTLDGKNISATYWDRTLRDFRKALAAARRQNVWDVVDVAFGSIVSVSFEMLVRSQLAMRLRSEYSRGWSGAAPRTSPDRRRALLTTTVAIKRRWHAETVCPSHTLYELRGSKGA